MKGKRKRLSPLGLQETIPHLSRSSLHRCLKRHGCSVLPKKHIPAFADKKKFKSYPIGYFHIDTPEVRTKEGQLYLYVAIDRTSKFAYAQLHKNQTKMVAAAFLGNLIKAIPYKIHKILTDKHRKTKVKHPWTNGQVERINRTLKDATVNTFYYASGEQLKKHLHDYLMAYNFAKRLKAIKGKTPWQFILDQWTKHPECFDLNPSQFLLGLNI